jgi:[glutamine synthetase] adenylyltransferase / [glutamine synthetase]-adenylyl-L-tyrosine phosphorylase
VIDGVGRLESRYQRPFGALIDTFVADSAQPALAVANLERWLSATGNPQVQIESLMDSPGSARVLGVLMGASQPIADSLIQCPELVSLLFDLRALSTLPTLASLESEGEQLLRSSTSSAHSRDRLRYLKQRALIPIVVGDLLSLHPAPAIWRALSDLADVLIRLAFELNWQEHRRLKDLPEVCPVAIIGFGKLGGQELNYSSDVDLVYVLQDEADERIERECVRFCEGFGRSLSDRMGRGSLFRVDLRLRPYGAGGAIVRRMHSFEGYYIRYAEPWEIQALMRSRCIVGPPEIALRWDEMVRTQCFRSRRSDMAMEELLSMRTRIEESAAENDIKRGAGGIRDVEFLVQLLQLIHGIEHESLRVRPTLDAIDSLASFGILDGELARSLKRDYTLLRTIEHRLQLVGDNQTHSVPASDNRRATIARLSGFASLTEFDSGLAETRKRVHEQYLDRLRPESMAPSPPTDVLVRLGPLGPRLTEWLDTIPGREGFYQTLAENEGSLRRVARILEDAPALVESLKTSIGLTELVWSGEIEEASDGPARIQAFPVDAPLNRVAAAYRDECIHATLRWVLDSSIPFPTTAPLTDAILTYLHRRTGERFDIIALGSLALETTILGSDADLLLLTTQAADQPVAESSAQEFLRLTEELHRLGSPLTIDLRLRPDGKRGLLVRSLDGLRAYDLNGMDMWERFALGHARLIAGDPENVRAVLRVAYGLPLTPERLRELTRMKRRIETERVYPSHVHRHVKLGYGGLSDIEWLVHLTEMRYPEATQAGLAHSMPLRIRKLAEVMLLNALERDQLFAAWDHHSSSRLRLKLLGHTDDLIPENPDRLDRLAKVLGFRIGNEFLAADRAHREATRAIFLDTLERLRG